MKIEIYGAIDLKVTHNVSSNPTRPSFIRIADPYEDNEILKLLDKPNVGIYGRGWTYGGDQGFKESSILVVVKKADGDQHCTFVGRTGLNEALTYLRELGATNPWHQKEMLGTA